MNHSVSDMNLGDFSSVVQLGVGLHAGTAILQSVGEFAGTPLTRRIERLKQLAEIKKKNSSKYEKVHDAACDLLGDLDVKKIQFFNEYRLLVLANTGVAISLGFLLACIAFIASWDCPWAVGLFIVILSFGPALVSITHLYNRWSKNTSHLLSEIEDIEKVLLGV